MSFLGFGWSTPTGPAAFLQSADIAVAQNSARDVILRNRMRRMGGGMNGGMNGSSSYRPQQTAAIWQARRSTGKYKRGVMGLGANPPKQETKAWWVWYSTQYLPQYYSQQEVQSRIVASPYYAQYGSPYTYAAPVTPVSSYYQYPYSTAQYPQYSANYPYYGYGSPYYNQVQGQYTEWQGEQGAAACAQQGGYYDYAQQSCQAITGQQPYGNTYGQLGPLPNVVGLPEWQAVSMLNGAGYNVWELNRDGVSQGIPPGYSSNRVDISLTNGVVTAAAVG